MTTAITTTGIIIIRTRIRIVGIVIATVIFIIIRENHAEISNRTAVNVGKTKTVNTGIDTKRPAVPKPVASRIHGLEKLAGVVQLVTAGKSGSKTEVLQLFRAND